ncbi:TetR family transcriptional regulator [Bosea sp. 124]|nr:TetR family transcriptional regulator [Bosea sp. 124]
MPTPKTMPMPKEETGEGARPRRRNMRGPDREQAILDEAIRFFAERGFDGQTRELAKRMGITHSAIYRHFPSKEALIERVYEHVYLSRWRPSWAPLITDRSRPLEARLTQFYREYVEQVFDHDWVRIFVFSGLRAFDITGRYLDIVRRRVIEPSCLELREELGLPATSDQPLGERETEMFWGLHGRIFYVAIRRYVYRTPTPQDMDQIVSDAVRGFFIGARILAPEMLSQGRLPAPA